MSEPQIIFREATTADELHELFCLRKRVILNSRISAVAKHNSAELDLECYDCFAHHMGLYLVSNGETRAIGYQRGVIEELGPVHDEVMRLARAYPAQELEVLRQRPFPFPCLGYLPEPEGIVGICNEYRKGGVGIGESTRFVIDESVRSLRLALFFVKCIISRYMFNDYLGLALTAVNSSSKRPYLELGFEQPRGFHDRYTPLLGQQSAPLCLDPRNVGFTLTEYYRGLATEFTANGAIRAYDAIVNKVLRRTVSVKRVA